jgi:hypothetical protein
VELERETSLEYHGLLLCPLIILRHRSLREAFRNLIAPFHKSMYLISYSYFHSTIFFSLQRVKCKYSSFHIASGDLRNKMLSSLCKQSSARSNAQRILTRGFAKEIKFGVEGRAAMLKGVNTLADAVQVRHNQFKLVCIIATLY